MALECIRIVVGHPFSEGGDWDLCVRMCSLCVCGVFVCLCVLCVWYACFTCDLACVCVRGCV